MTLPELHSLMLILTVAVLAPLLCEWIPRIRLPLVVMEISLGILAGPQVLGWATAGPTIQILANFGLAFLFSWLDSKSISRPFEVGRFSWRHSDGLCLW
jgi:Kef-type K+ transport system membrane component KefB